MGIVEGVGFAEWPPQRRDVGRRVRVAFHYDTSRTIGGKIVRSDGGPPWETLIYLDDGRTIRDAECQYQFTDEAEPARDSAAQQDV